MVRKVRYYDSFFKPLMGTSHGHESLVNVSGAYGALMVLLFGIGWIMVAIMIPHRELLDEADLSQLKADERAEIESNGKFEIERFIAKYSHVDAIVLKVKSPSCGAMVRRLF